MNNISAETADSLLPKRTEQCRYHSSLEFLAATKRWVLMNIVKPLPEFNLWPGINIYIEHTAPILGKVTVIDYGLPSERLERYTGQPSAYGIVRRERYRESEAQTVGEF